MDIKLSWDLFVIVFLAIIMAYSFIVGRKQTIKIIIATYVSFLASDALALFLDKTVGFKIPAKVFGFDPIMGAIVAKILIFITLIIIFSRHHAFDIGVDDGVSDPAYLLSTAFIGFLSSILMVSCMLYYISGDFLTALTSAKQLGILAEIEMQSELVQKILTYFHVWIFLPALSLVTLTFMQRK